MSDGRRGRGSRRGRGTKGTEKETAAKRLRLLPDTAYRARLESAWRSPPESISDMSELSTSRMAEIDFPIRTTFTYSDRFNEASLSSTQSELTLFTTHSDAAIGLPSDTSSGLLSAMEIDLPLAITLNSPSALHDASSSALLSNLSTASPTRSTFATLSTSPSTSTASTTFAMPFTRPPMVPSTSNTLMSGPSPNWKSAFDNQDDPPKKCATSPKISIATKRCTMTTNTRAVRARFDFDQEQSPSVATQSTSVATPSTSNYTPSTPVYTSTTPSTPVYTPSNPVYTLSTSLYAPLPTVPTRSTPFYTPSNSVNTPSNPVYTPSFPACAPSPTVYTPLTTDYTPPTPAYNPPTSVYIPFSSLPASYDTLSTLDNIPSTSRAAPTRSMTSAYNLPTSVNTPPTPAYNPPTSVYIPFSSLPASYDTLSTLDNIPSTSRAAPTRSMTSAYNLPTSVNTPPTPAYNPPTSIYFPFSSLSALDNIPSTSRAAPTRSMTSAYNLPTSVNTPPTPAYNPPSSIYFPFSSLSALDNIPSTSRAAPARSMTTSYNPPTSVNTPSTPAYNPPTSVYTPFSSLPASYDTLSALDNIPSTSRAARAENENRVIIQDQTSRIDEKPKEPVENPKEPVEKPKGPESQKSEKDTFENRLLIGDPSRMKEIYGKLGQTIELEANYLQLAPRLRNRWKIHRYSLVMLPVYNSDALAAHLLNIEYLYDGKYIYVPKEIQRGTFISSVNNCEYKLTIKTKTAKMDNDEILSLVNMIVHRIYSRQGYKHKGRNICNPQDMEAMEEFNMELFKVYNILVRKQEERHLETFLIRCDLTFKIMRRESVYDLLERSRRNLDFEKSFENSIQDKIVTTVYNFRNYRIAEVNFKATPMSTFEMKNEQISFLDYYTKKNIKFRDMSQPMLICRPRVAGVSCTVTSHVMLIPELCREIDVSEEFNQARFKQIVSEKTRLTPAQRYAALLQFCTNLNHEHVLIKVWKLNLGSMVSLGARTFGTEEIITGSKTYTECNYAEWTNLFNTKKECVFLTPIRCLLHIICPEKFVKKTLDFVHGLIRFGADIGCYLSVGNTYAYTGDSCNYYDTFKNITQISPHVAFALVVLPSYNTDSYGEIKATSSLAYPVLTQVILGSTIERADRRLISMKMCVQIYTKLGFCPWLVPWEFDEIMVIGYDFARDVYGTDKFFGACVTACNLHSRGAFYSEAQTIMKSDDLPTKIWELLEGGLRAFFKYNNYYPKQIIFYRVGTSTDLGNNRYRNEVEVIVRRLGEFSSDNNINYVPAFGYIIVVKSSKTRLFVKARFNPPPGTVVDTTITNQGHYDFFLASQKVAGGSSLMPTYYDIIYTTLRLTADEIQRCTYKLTHTYYNWCGTIRIPAVCQYAKKLVTLIATHIHNLPNEKLQNSFFYL